MRMSRSGDRGAAREERAALPPSAAPSHRSHAGAAARRSRSGRYLVVGEEDAAVSGDSGRTRLIRHPATPSANGSVIRQTVPRSRALEVQLAARRGDELLGNGEPEPRPLVVRPVFDEKNGSKMRARIPLVDASALVRDRDRRRAADDLGTEWTTPPGGDASIAFCTT